MPESLTPRYEHLASTSCRYVNTVTDMNWSYQTQAGVATLPADLVSDYEDFYAVVALLLQNDTAGETTEARLLDVTNGIAYTAPEAVVSHTGPTYTQYQTEPVKLQDASIEGVAQFGTEGRVTAGKGVHDRITISVYGRR